MANNKDGVEFRLFDTDLATVLGVLPAAEMKLDLVLNEPGSGSVRIPLKSNAAALMESAMFAEGKYRGGVRGGFFVENIEKIEAASGENEAQQMSISGRGALALLDDAIVWDDGTGATTRDLSGTRAGMLIDLIEEAKARGALLNLDYDFTDTTDSNGVAWTDDEDLAWAVDTSLLEVARAIAKAGIDLDVVPDGSGNFILSAYKNGKGTDKSSTVYFRIGVNCEEVSSLEAGGEIRNVLRVRYKSGSTTVSDATSISTRRRREKGLNAREAQSSDSARTIGAAELDLSKDPKKSITVTIYDGKGPRVFVDYVLGDYITLDNKGVETVYRVRGIQAAWDGKKYADVVVDLNSIILEHEIRMAQDIGWLMSQWETARDANLLEARYWAAIGDVAGTSVNALAISDAGKLYVGGDFDSIANVSASNVAFCDLNTGIWSALGSGFNDACYSIICDGTTIYFSGDFTNAGGVTVARVASYSEGSGTFSALSTGLANGGRALALDGSTLWAAQYAKISKYSGGIWTHYEPPFLSFTNGITNILSMAIGSGIIYIGGQFPIDGGIGPYGSDLYKYVIATDTWTKITTTLDVSSSVYALAVLNGYLYVGGNFTARNGTASTRHLAKVNLSSLAYSAVGGGMSGSNFIYALHVMGVDLYIGGAFTTIGTDALAALRIAKWDGESFSMLDTGLDNEVYAVTHDHNNLLGNIFAGGIFANAGDKPLVKVGEYITNFEALLDHMENSSNSSFDLAAAIHGATEKTSLANADEVSLWDSVSSALRKITWQNIKAAIKTYADTLYVALTGNQTIAGIKTFSSDPIVPDEAYDATAWNGSMEPPTKNAIRDKIETMSGGTPGGTDTQVQFNDSGAFAGNAGLRINKTTGEVFIGDQVPAPTQNKSLAQGAEGLSAGHLLWTWGTGFASFVSGFFARGTFASPTAAQTDDNALKLRGRFYDGSTYPANNTEVRFVANQNQSSTAHGGRVEIYTTPDGSTTLTKAATFGADQSLAVVGAVSGSNLSGTNTGDSVSVPINGWIPDTHTWTRTGNHTFTISGNATSYLTKGCFVKYTDSAPSDDYGVVYSSVYSSGPNTTTITLITNTNFVMAAGSISATYYSYMANPAGWPGTFDYTPTISAQSGSFTSVTINSAKYFTMANSLDMKVDITVVNKGTASGILLVAAPCTLVASGATGTGREDDVTGSMLQFYQYYGGSVIASTGVAITNGYHYKLGISSLTF